MLFSNNEMIGNNVINIGAKEFSVILMILFIG